MPNPGKHMYKLILLLALMLSGVSVLAQGPRVDAQLSTSTIKADESVVLNVRAYGLDKELDASALDKDFQVVARSSSRQVSILNGQRTSIVEWVLELVPKRSGPLTIPPIIVGSEESRPVTLIVEEAATGSRRELYVEATVDQIDPYVQSQVVYAVKVFQDVQILDGSLGVPESDKIQVRQLGGDTNSRETIDGRTYSVLTRRYVVFPQESGEIIIPPIQLQATVAVDRSLNPNTTRRTRRLTRLSNPVTIDVKPRPGTASGWWLPAKSVSLTQEWSQALDSVTVDQPITRSIRMLAAGVGDAQLPDITVPDVEKISIYADAPESTTETRGDGLWSVQRSSWAIIPQVAGALILPAVQVPWFNTQTGLMELAELPRQILNVKPNPNNSAAGVQQSDAARPNSLSNQSPNNSATEAGSNGSNALGSNRSENGDQSVGSVNENAAGGLAGPAAVLAPGSISASYWKPIALAAIAGWLCSLALAWAWWRRNRESLQAKSYTPESPESERARFYRRASAKASLAGLHEACATNDASKISRALMAWADMVWPDKPPTHTGDIGSRLQSAELKKTLAILDAARFGDASKASGEELAALPETLELALHEQAGLREQNATSQMLPRL